MLSVFLGGEASELFFVVVYSGGDGFQGGAQGGDLVGEGRLNEKRCKQI